ncbi:MAG: cobalamin biosynthesis bifunctional protein CbiET [Nocardioides sp.]|nr:cobalamin biosynthesis bifunctional protein CbiET [Nocardioides sp.]
MGIGADGWAGLGEASRARLEAAAVVVGSSRQLGLLPEVDGQLRRAWPTPLSYDLLSDYVDRPVAVLASGDPMLSGIGSALIRALGPDVVEVLPAVSSVSLALARLRWSAERTQVLSLVGRRPEQVLRHLAPGHEVLVLSSDESTPGRVAELLVAVGYGETHMIVLGDLGGAEESRTDGVAATWDAEAPRLHVLALHLRGPVVGSWAAGLPDDAYEHDGQLTKRDLRASALARLMPQPGQTLWDVGAGAGSVGIEWMRAHPTCRAVAFEADAERAARIRRNAARLGVPGLEVVHGSAPEILGSSPHPHAVFVGGGATTPGLLLRCREVLPRGGRLVAHGVTVETERELGVQYARHGGELTRIAVETAAPIGSYTGWAPARTVTQWSWSAS